MEELRISVLAIVAQKIGSDMHGCGLKKKLRKSEAAESEIQIPTCR
jgi:hypothetical protein